MNRQNKIIHKITVLLFSTVLISLWFVFLLIFFWAICFHWYCFGMLLLLAVVALLPFKIRKQLYIKPRLILLGIMIFLSVSLFEIAVNELNNRIAQLAAKPRNQDSLADFFLRDKIGIYGLNVIIGAVAYPLYPEAARETLFMIFKKPNGIRIFESDFALGSVKIRKVLESFRENLETHPGDKAEFKKQVFWPLSDYAFGNEESRYALALNPVDVSILAIKRNSRWDMEVHLQVRCGYPRNSYVTLMTKPELKMEEGLFWILQQAGWLHPYLAEYHFHLKE